MCLPYKNYEQPQVTVAPIAYKITELDLSCDWTIYTTKRSVSYIFLKNVGS